MTSPIKYTTDIISTKWTVLIIHELASEPKKFSELERAIPGLTPRTLSKRLDELKASGIISNCSGDPDYSDTCYRLTSKGADLIPILDKMTEWGKKYPRPITWNIA